MNIRKGKTRVVLLVGSLAIKFPRVFLYEAFEAFFWYLTDGGWKDVKYFLKYELEFLLWRGIFCNFREFLFYRIYKLPLLAPTYFSLFGIINFQKAGDVLQMSCQDVWSQIYNQTKKISFEDHDQHTFREAENYCVIDGKLAMVDYGDIQTQWVLKRYGEAIYKNFDLNFRRGKFQV